MDLLGYVGGGILAVQMWPQIVKTVRLGDASQLSWSMLACNVVGLGCMTAYGFVGSDIPLCSTASMSLVNSLVLSGLKYRCEFMRVEDSLSNVDGNIVNHQV